MASPAFNKHFYPSVKTNFGDFISVCRKSFRANHTVADLLETWKGKRDNIKL